MSEPYTKTKQGYRLDFEFTSGGGSDNIGGGIYRIPSCDAVFLGDKNRELFETWEAWIRDWMALPLPPALLEKKVNARHAQRNRETSEGVETTTATTKVNKKKV